MRRAVRDVIADHDDDVRDLVSDAQWQLYEAYKSDLEEQLLSGIDIVDLR